MSEFWKMVELKDGEPVVFLAVHALRWQPEWGEPKVGFIQIDEEEDELRAELTAARDEIVSLHARCEVLEGAWNTANAERERLRSFHPRATKLIDKRKNFVVVAEDETYFIDVYQTIRAREKEKGRWTDEDETQYQNAFTDWAWRMEWNSNE